MPEDQRYGHTELTREEVDGWAGPAVVEFGANWCGYCQNAQPIVLNALSEYPAIPHTKVEDGPGRPLGRSYRVKLWPTLIFLKDGVEQSRVVRPESADEIRESLAQIAPS